MGKPDGCAVVSASRRTRRGPRKQSMDQLWRRGWLDGHSRGAARHAPRGGLGGRKPRAHGGYGAIRWRKMDTRRPRGFFLRHRLARTIRIVRRIDLVWRI